MEQKTITLSILLVGIMAMIFPAHAAQGQIFLTNEMPKFTTQQQGQQLDPGFMSFEQFMQYMFYYEKMFGKDYVTKIYKEYHNDDDDDDDDDNDRKKHHKDKDWWKHNSKDKDWWKEHNDKKKYCEGKGEWKNGKCHYNSKEDKTAHEDAVCDNAKKKSKFCGNANNNKDKDDEPIGYDKEGNRLNTINGDYDEVEEDDNADSIEEANEKLNDLFNDENENENNNDSDVKDQDEEEEEEEEDDEPEEDDEEEEESDSDDSDGGDGDEE